MMNKQTAAEMIETMRTSLRYVSRGSPTTAPDLIVSAWCRLLGMLEGETDTRHDDLIPVAAFDAQKGDAQ
jgi:hypothetical protein